MQSLTALAMEPLEWRRTAWGDRSWELHADSALLGTLRLDGIFRVVGRAETDAGQWEISRQGAFGRRILVRAVDARQDAAAFTRRWLGKGMLRFANGREMSWEPTNFWMSRWAFLAEHRQPLLEFGRAGGVLRRGYTVTVARDARGVRELPILVSLGLFLLVLSARANHH